MRRVHPGEAWLASFSLCLFYFGSMDLARGHAFRFPEELLVVLGLATLLWPILASKRDLWR